MSRLPPLYAVEGRVVNLGAMEAEYLSTDNPDLQLIYLFLEVRFLREIARLAAEIRRDQFVSAPDRSEVEAELDDRLISVVFREPAQISLFGGPK